MIKNPLISSLVCLVLNNLFTELYNSSLNEYKNRSQTYVFITSKECLY